MILGLLTRWNRAILGYSGGGRIELRDQDAGWVILTGDVNK
jgi:hypothetical protein